MDEVKNKILEQYPFFDTIFETRAAARLANQYQESSAVVGEIKAAAAELDKIRTALLECMTFRWIETAVGKNLDAVGEIVGQPRTSIEALYYFGYSANPFAVGYGAGRYKIRGEPEVGERLLPDPEYRLAIKSRAFGNRSPSTPEALTAHIFFVFGKKTLIQNGFAEIRIYFAGELTKNEILFLTYQWRDGFGQVHDFFSYTLGVGRIFFYQGQTDKFFGYRNNPAAYGYGVGGYSHRII